VKYCIVGGFAVSYRAEPRLTRDIDITLSVTSDEEAEVIIRNISSTGLVAETVLENSVLGVISTVRLVNPSSSRKIYTDLLFRSCGIEESSAVVGLRKRSLDPPLRMSYFPGSALFQSQPFHL
jgi:hypothetical protein